MTHSEWLSNIDGNEQLREFYNELQRDILDVAYNEKDCTVKKSDIWKVVIQEGLYQNLVENVSVAIGFFLITSYGPRADYKEYLDLADDYDDVVVLVALSALANDTNHRENYYLNDKTMPSRIGSGEYPWSDMAELSYKDKEKRAKKLLSCTDCAISESELTLDVGLYDCAPIDYLDTDESLEFLFKSQSYGYLVGDMETSVDPSDDACSYTIITNKRVLVIVGIENLSDRVLSIPIHAITDVDINRGWTKDKIKLNTKSQDDNGPYQIWVPNITSYDEDSIIDRLQV